MNSKSIVCALLLPGVLGCATATLKGKKITGTVQGRAQGGIVYYLSKPEFSIVVKDLHEKKRATPVYDFTVSFVPDPDHAYEVWLESGSFTNDSFTLKLTADGRLDGLGVTSEGQLPSLVTSIGALVGTALLAEADVAKAAVEAEDPILAILKQARDQSVIEQTELDNARGVHANPAAATPDQIHQAIRTARKIIAAWGLRISAAKTVCELEDPPNGEIHSPTGPCPPCDKDSPDKDRCYCEVRYLRKWVSVLGRALGRPRAELEDYVEEKRAVAEAAYLKYIRDGTDPKLELEDYREAVQRLIEYDDRLARSKTPVRRQKLEAYFNENPSGEKQTGNESKAYKEYREELDRLVSLISAQVAAVAEARKPAARPPDGTQASRTLTEYLEAREAPTKGHLFRADMCLEYTETEFIVFRENKGGA